ncbi:MAG: metallophosphoesterase [Bacteroidales bacterium]|nr:metallophosphoesterase [Bacteroidales bacterium]
MIYITGDCHGDWSRFSSDSFPEGKNMTRDDFVIVCGDFGIWQPSNSEKYWLDWLSEKSFTVLFVDGNHENFDRLNGGEFPIVDFHGGKAHKIRENVYHLMRGYIFDICGKSVFAFGGARSHDIKDGILNEDDYPNYLDMIKDYRIRTKRGEMLRINHMSWWKEEMPNAEEMRRGLNNLKARGNKVDFIISHCCPQRMVPYFLGENAKPDSLTKFFNVITRDVEFDRWYFGHYHDNMQMGKYTLLYEQIIRIA